MIWIELAWVEHKHSLHQTLVFNGIICYLDFVHAVRHRLPVDTIDDWSQTFTFEARAHVATLLLLATGQHTPPQHIWDSCG